MERLAKLKKEYLLIAGTVILLYISYQLAFKKTVDAMQAHNDLTLSIASASDLSYQPGYLERKTKNLDAIINKYKMDSLSLRGNTLALISQIADKEHVKLSEVPDQDLLYRNEHFIIQRLDFEGDYFDLTRMLRTFEVTVGIGIPRTVTWKTADKVSGTQKKKSLTLQVCFEIKK
ncbi:hypothetical protein KXQ82_10460 [Mucilaginibacter sp. HMF5004]|uniref:hypothetical protein n=1 Tax=Mucilaginibacter rivuli TaxID=2857527 RepID=UPI001C5F798F|nr:hypothetical protein [Mucilaginibacter rivuli]MBW4890141.1 hypothetical protein [Mucilaginibacter rivuli]